MSLSAGDSAGLQSQESTKFAFGATRRQRHYESFDASFKKKSVFFLKLIHDCTFTSHLVVANPRKDLQRHFRCCVHGSKV